MHTAENLSVHVECTLCLKKTSPTFLAITRKALSDSHNVWQKRY